MPVTAHPSHIDVWAPQRSSPVCGAGFSKPNDLSFQKIRPVYGYLQLLEKSTETWDETPRVHLSHMGEAIGVFVKFLESLREFDPEGWQLPLTSSTQKVNQRGRAREQPMPSWPHRLTGERLLLPQTRHREPPCRSNCPGTLRQLDSTGNRLPKILFGVEIEFHHSLQQLVAGKAWEVVENKLLCEQLTYVS